MNKNGACGIIGAMLFAVIASSATAANAQSGVTALTDGLTDGMTDGPAHAVAVSTSTPGTRPDTSIVRDVRRALRRVPEMDDSDIHIRSSHGVVTLTGSVPESWQISRAGNTARSVLGVRSVSNRLTGRKPDAAASE